MTALIMASATLRPSVYATARRGGLRGAGGLATDPTCTWGLWHVHGCLLVPW